MLLVEELGTVSGRELPNLEQADIPIDGAKPSKCAALRNGYLGRQRLVLRRVHHAALK